MKMIGPECAYPEKIYIESDSNFNLFGIAFGHRRMTCRLFMEMKERNTRRKNNIELRSIQKFDGFMIQFKSVKINGRWDGWGVLYEILCERMSQN